MIAFWHLLAALLHHWGSLCLNGQGLPFLIFVHHHPQIVCAVPQK